MYGVFVTACYLCEDVWEVAFSVQCMYCELCRSKMLPEAFETDMISLCDKNIQIHTDT